MYRRIFPDIDYLTLACFSKGMSELHSFILAVSLLLVGF